MSIEHIILGFLCQKPMSGYTIKKLIVEAPFFNSSANNNQIYKSLIGLRERGFADVSVVEKERGAASKVYSITPAGKLELQTWVKSLPECLELHSAFHQHLAFAHTLNNPELEALFLAYEAEVQTQIASAKELLRRFETAAGEPVERNEQIRYLSWRSIFQHRVQMLELESRWLEHTKQQVLSSVMPHAKNKVTI